MAGKGAGREGHVVKNRRVRPARFQLVQIEGDGEQRCLIQVDQMAQPARHGQIQRGRAASGYNLPAVIRQGEDLDGVLVRVKRHGGLEQNRFSSGKNLRETESNLSLANRGDRLGRTATSG